MPPRCTKAQLLEENAKLRADLQEWHRLAQMGTEQLNRRDEIIQKLEADVECYKSFAEDWKTAALEASETHFNTKEELKT